MEDEVFMSNLKGSALANFVTGVLFIVFWIIKNKCKHSRCTWHTRYCDCSIKEDDDREEGQRKGRREVRREETIKNTRKIKIGVQKVQSELNPSVPEKYKEVV